MNTSSIRFRLSAWYAGLLTLVYVLFGALLMHSVQSFLEASALDTQARRARQIASTLVTPLAPADSSGLGPLRPTSPPILEPGDPELETK